MDHGEVPPVGRCDVCNSKTFGCRHDRCIDGAEWQVVVATDQFCDAEPVARSDRFWDQVAHGQVAEKPDLRLDPKPGLQQIGHLGDDKGRDDERSGVGFEEVDARLVITIVTVDVGVERARVDDQRDESTSLARICSIRSEMSEWPLAPAPEARSLRRFTGPPKWASIASRVSSETVVPRLLASCRRRASSSSESFTVVRCMYANIPRASALDREVQVHCGSALRSCPGGS